MRGGGRGGLHWIRCNYRPGGGGCVGEGPAHWGRWPGWVPTGAVVYGGTGWAGAEAPIRGQACPYGQRGSYKAALMVVLGTPVA